MLIMLRIEKWAGGWVCTVDSLLLFEGGCLLLLASGMCGSNYTQHWGSTNMASGAEIATERSA